MFSMDFPRKLTGKELDLLFRILPADKTGYLKYRELLEEYYLIGTRPDGLSFIFSKSTDPEDNIFVTPIFAAGTFTYEDKLYDIVIHEEADDKIEVEISVTNTHGNQVPDIIYSAWKPGMKAPGDNSLIREIKLQKGKYFLVFAPSQEKIWVYDSISGVNHFITTGIFHSSLCIIRNVRDPEIVLKPKLLFKNLDSYSDNELISAFYLYNKSSRKFSIEISDETVKPKKTNVLKKIFKKENN